MSLRFIVEGDGSNEEGNALERSRRSVVCSDCNCERRGREKETLRTLKCSANSLYPREQRPCDHSKRCS